jgi:hypothetical protein
MSKENRSTEKTLSAPPHKNKHGAAESQPKHKKPPEKIAQRRGDMENSILSILPIHVDISPVPGSSGRETWRYRIYRILPPQNHRDLHRLLEIVVGIHRSYRIQCALSISCNSSASMPL